MRAWGVSHFPPQPCLSMIDPFRLCVAFGPLAIYCLLLGLINLLRRPIVVTGAKDTAALAMALTGLMVIGPLELFMPQAAAMRFGGYVWLLLLSFYGLSISLVLLLSRPRLVIYNISSEQLRPILGEVVPALDSQARWAGDSLAMPTLGVQLHLDNFPSMRNVSLVANGEQQSFEGWRRLEKALTGALRQQTWERYHPRGLVLMMGGLLLLAACLFESVSDPQALAQGMRDLLRL